jgi:hypothetical protein
MQSLSPLLSTRLSAFKSSGTTEGLASSKNVARTGSRPDFHVSNVYSAFNKRLALDFLKGLNFNHLCCFQITSQKKKTGVIAPKQFVNRVKKQNELFRSYMHQV